LRKWGRPAIVAIVKMERGVMLHERFKELVDSLDGKYKRLMSMPPVIAEEIPSDTPTGGIYLFSENGMHLYTGRTKRKIAIRVRNHFNTAPDCPFAWLLAREATGKRATYKQNGSRKDLLSNPKFLSVYNRAKERIRKMQVRYVEEPDPLRQALLEIYVAIAAKTKYNDFDTH